MAIQREFVLRYRHEGHLRFQLPERACRPRAAEALVNRIRELPGVRAVDLFRGQRKLAIRFQEAVCDFTGLARAMHKALAELEAEGCFDDIPATKAAGRLALGIKRRLKNTRVGAWFGEKVQAGKETVEAAKVLGKLSSKGPKALFKDPEKAVIDFLNDVLVLYLIKAHWPRITQQWLPRPWAYRYEWLAVFYMFFLLVRSRRPK
ncbi:hypothetical protein [Methylomonas sp. UP202]|uniref:hypothetical protein n=1 Tax=Methylomonas sp. UP202 TaxID=3040943 RepID=UPI00143ACA4B|nr:hypothetical protein [Methylomonas sp. UP202]NJA08284.1 hypothetical protein [Methylococcaceae bacterium WWC4]WGS84665.1 hypothetical protein QC632_16585 [Methylomonas sp. UP202]